MAGSAVLIAFTLSVIAAVGGVWADGGGGNNCPVTNTAAIDSNALAEPGITWT